MCSDPNTAAPPRSGAATLRGPPRLGAPRAQPADILQHSLCACSVRSARRARTWLPRGGARRPSRSTSGLARQRSGRGCPPRLRMWGAVGREVAHAEQEVCRVDSLRPRAGEPPGRRAHRRRAQPPGAGLSCGQGRPEPRLRVGQKPAQLRPAGADARGVRPAGVRARALGARRRAEAAAGDDGSGPNY